MISVCCCTLETTYAFDLKRRSFIECFSQTSNVTLELSEVSLDKNLVHKQYPRSGLYSLDYQLCPSQWLATLYPR